MKSIKNLRIWSKRVTVVSTAVFAGLTVGMCRDYEKQAKDVETTPVGCLDGDDSRNAQTSVKEIITTSLNNSSDYLFTTKSIITDKINSNSIYEENKVDDVTTLTTTNEEISSISHATKPIENNSISKSDVVRPSTKPIETTLISKSITIKLTISTTTETTMETSDAEEPEQQSISEVSDDGLYGIRDGIDTFGNYAGYLANDIIANSGHTNSFVSIDLGYGRTLMGGECCLILEALNPEVSEDVLDWNFTGYSIDTLYNFKTFMYNFKYVLDRFNGDIDYSKYTLNANVGNCLNDADQASRDGRFDEFMNDFCNNQNYDAEIKNNPGAMAILYSYDKGNYLDFNTIDNMLSSNIDYVNDVVNTNTFVK